MSHTLYLECGSGISGDMTVAALLDLGADQKVLEQALSSLPVDGYQVKISRVSKCGLDVCDFDVQLDQHHENHDHDMDYLHGHQEAHHHHHHTHEHDEHHHHEHPHEHRNLHEILSIIQQGDLTPGAASLARRIFEILAQGEAKAHGVPVEQVHFHEVGAVDSIVDIVAAAVCLDNLDIQQVIIPSLSEGTGFVRCQHGVIPIPVPATINIVQEYGLTLHMAQMEGELVTPTGAAIAAAIKTGDKLPQQFRVEKVGIGAGKRNYERPSLLRGMLIEDTSQQKEGVWKLESNLDDCSGELLGYLLERLLESGAKEVYYTPVYMKKNRPAWQLNVLCDEDHLEEMERIIFAESTTIGIRRIWMERTVLPRTKSQVSTPWGPVEVKVCQTPEGARIYLEYESAKAVARSSGEPLQRIYDAVGEAAKTVEK